MYKIDTASNSLMPLTVRTFRDLGFKERPNLQEWIAKEPSCLGEELLVIQKEFSGFADTTERLDLLALDKRGYLVLIENKLDDTGRDVTWQALKYASYCSTLSKEDVRSIYQQFLDKTNPRADARTSIADFFADVYEDVTINEGLNPRIILVAANFRKEVTSTVLWLLNFNLRVQCIRVVPYSMGDEHFLNIEQIIPTKDAEEYIIRLAAKAKEENEGASKPLNYVPPKLDYEGIIRKCEEKGSKIEVGFLHGIKKLGSTPLESLRQKLYKWDSIDTPAAGKKISENWIKGDVFLHECRLKEASQPESAIL